MQVEPPLRPLPGAFGRARAVLTDPAGWRACAYLLLKLLLSVLSVLSVIYLVAWGVPYLTFPIWWEILHANGVVIHVPGWLMWWKPDPLLVVQSVHSLAVSFALVPAGLAALLYCPWWLKGCNAQDGKLVVRLLGPPLGDRVRELEQSRAHAVDDSAARLRRIERDLHDGAQAQMVAVAMKLGLAREKLGGTVTGITEADMERALDLVDAAHRGAKEAIRRGPRSGHGPAPGHPRGSEPEPKSRSAADQARAELAQQTGAQGHPRWRSCRARCCCGCSRRRGPEADRGWPGRRGAATGEAGQVRRGDGTVRMVRQLPDESRVSPCDPVAGTAAGPRSRSNQIRSGGATRRQTAGARRSVKPQDAGRRRGRADR